MIIFGLTFESPGDCMSGQHVSVMVGVEVSASLLLILLPSCVYVLILA